MNSNKTGKYQTTRVENMTFAIPNDAQLSCHLVTGNEK